MFGNIKRVVKILVVGALITVPLMWIAGTKSKVEAATYQVTFTNNGWPVDGNPPRFTFYTERPWEGYQVLVDNLPHEVYCNPQPPGDTQSECSMILHNVPPDASLAVTATGDGMETPFSEKVNYTESSHSGMPNYNRAPRIRRIFLPGVEDPITDFVLPINPLGNIHSGDVQVYAEDSYGPGLAVSVNGNKAFWDSENRVYTIPFNNVGLEKGVNVIPIEAYDNAGNYTGVEVKVVIKGGEIKTLSIEPINSKGGRLEDKLKIYNHIRDPISVTINNLIPNEYSEGGSNPYFTLDSGLRPGRNFFSIYHGKKITTHEFDIKEGENPCFDLYQLFNTPAISMRK